MELTANRVATIVIIASISSLIGCSRSPSDEDFAKLTATVAQSKEQSDKLESELTQIRDRLGEVEKALLKASDEASSGTKRVNMANISKTISKCVRVVRQSAPSGATALTDVHVTFDAYFNPTTGRVQNNNQYADQTAVYEFNKCMAVHGVPLK